MDPIVSSLPEKQIISLEEKEIVQETAKDQVMEVPHIDFILWDRRLIFKDCKQMGKIQELKPLMVRSHIQALVKTSEEKTLPIYFESGGKDCI